jgi:hypothetical protein
LSDERDHPDLPDDLSDEPDQPDDGPKRRSTSASIPVKTSVVGTVVAVVCLYELVAEGVNTALQEPVLPSASTAIQRFRGRAFAAHLAPRSARLGAMMGTGYVIGVLTRASKR